MNHDESGRPAASTTGPAYTGVGSRQTPPAWQAVLESLGETLARAGYTLRSGAADGADSAFERGARRVANAPCEIYLPWPGFSEHASPLATVGEKALELARSVHPAWPALKPAVQKLHGRNTYQVLGRTLDRPAAFLIAWTADGCEREADRTRQTGGTATAIVLAERRGIPVFNLGRRGRSGDLARFLAERRVAWQAPSEDGGQLTLAGLGQGLR